MVCELKRSPEANYNPFFVNYYCYDKDCPARTKEEPWPRSDEDYKSVKIISRNGKPYYKKKWICRHCGKEMTGAINASVFE